jgi:hypothetical protein
MGTGTVQENVGVTRLSFNAVENLLWAAWQNIQAHRHLRPSQLAMLLKTDAVVATALCDTLIQRMLATRNANGSYSPRPQGDGLKHPRTFEAIEGRSMIVKVQLTS